MSISPLVTLARAQRWSVGDEMNSTLDVLGLRFWQGSPLELPSKHWICQFVRPGDRAETMGVHGITLGERKGPEPQVHTVR